MIAVNVYGGDNIINVWYIFEKEMLLVGVFLLICTGSGRATSGMEALLQVVRVATCHLPIHEGLVGTTKGDTRSKDAGVSWNYVQLRQVHTVFMNQGEDYLWRERFHDWYRTAAPLTISHFVTKTISISTTTACALIFISRLVDNTYLLLFQSEPVKIVKKPSCLIFCAASVPFFKGNP